MNKFFRYSLYLFKHKWYVAVVCFRYGLIWRGIVHDWTKILPCEFIPYMRRFGGVKGISSGRDKSGAYDAANTGDEAFTKAWWHHQKHNDHHWQFWTMPGDYGKLKVLPMPEKVRKEMLADWVGAGKAQKTNGPLEWYKENRDKLILHDETRKWVENELGCRNN